MTHGNTGCFLGLKGLVWEINIFATGMGIQAGSSCTDPCAEARGLQLSPTPFAGRGRPRHMPTWSGPGCSLLPPLLEVWWPLSPFPSVLYFQCQHFGVGAVCAACMCCYQGAVSRRAGICSNAHVAPSAPTHPALVHAHVCLLPSHI